ncbi:hypothetical protein ACHAXR_010386 [Thalassiosira sp. AJA248-18]
MSCLERIDNYFSGVGVRGYTCKKENVAQQPCRLCPLGYYCSDKFQMHPCGAVDVYCPLGSVQPTPVSDGYFTVEGDEDTRGAQEQCEAGFYCTGGVKRKCEAGFYCPTPGTTLTTRLECGSSTVFCEEGSIEPSLVWRGYFSVGGTNETTRTGQQIAPKGHYASNGIVKPCHEGHFSSSKGMFDESCSGICEGGWYCPEGSTSSMQIACGGEDRFCPPGSARPQQVQPGYYTSTDEEPCRPGTYREAYPDTDGDVSPIATSRMEGRCVPCPDGTFKPVSGNDMKLCRECGPKAKSTHGRISCECHQSATERALFQLYFDPMKTQCLNISDVLSYNLMPPDELHLPGTQVTKMKELPCEKGHYCHEGTRYRCQGGRFGDRDIETNEDCSGPCEEGHWCGEASTSGRQNKCGRPNAYCPRESSSPIYVSEGYYTNEDDMRMSQHLCEPGFYCQNGLKMPCEAGTYGASAGLSEKSCNGRCQAGYYCLTASISPNQFPCGNSTVYCPEGSKLPSLTKEGYYSASENDIAVADFYAGPNSTHQIEGFFCTGGAKFSCPAGTFGTNAGASDVSECQRCEAGFYCPSHPGPPTTVETLVPCGDAYVYCPPGSSEPLNVDLGYYSITESEKATSGRATAQAICEPGFKCQNGLKMPCEAGTYGETSGLATDDCTGLCPRSFFCPRNSVHPLPCSPGAYSTGGARQCTSCNVPTTVPAEVIQNMCRDDRSCCLDVFE